MKTGRTIPEVALELKRQRENRRDYIIDTRLMTMGLLDDRLAFNMPEEIGPLGIRETTHQQVGAHLEIPAKYYNRLRADHPKLLAYNVNSLFQAEPSKRMVRTLDGDARAFLSNRYRILDHIEIIEAVWPILETIPDARVESCEVTDTRMYIKVVNPRLTTDVTPGDTVQSGIVISNSETGHGTVSVSPLIYRLVCSNGMVVNDAGARKYHIGRANHATENFELYSDETLKADDNAFMLKLQDIVKAATDEVRFNKVVDIMREAQGVKITNNDIPKVVELTGKEFGISQDEGKGVLRHLIEGGDLSLYGLSNAATRFSQDLDNYDRATDFEALGYSILTMSPALWNKINTTA